MNLFEVAKLKQVAGVPLTETEMSALCEIRDPNDSNTQEMFRYTIAPIETAQELDDMSAALAMFGTTRPSQNQNWKGRFWGVKDSSGSWVAGVYPAKKQVFGMRGNKITDSGLLQAIEREVPGMVSSGVLGTAVREAKLKRAAGAVD